MMQLERRDVWAIGMQKNPRFCFVLFVTKTAPGTHAQQKNVILK